MNSIRKKVFDTIVSMNISYDVIEHPAVYTIEEMDKLNIDSKNEVAKNLFVRDDKKKRYFLIVHNLFFDKLSDFSMIFLTKIEVISLY